MTYLYKAISAACRTGYASRPSLRSASEIAVSSAAFLDTANFDYMRQNLTCIVNEKHTFQVVIRCNLPTGLMGLKYQHNSVCSLTCHQLTQFSERTSSWKYKHVRSGSTPQANKLASIFLLDSMRISGFWGKVIAWRPTIDR